MMNLNIKLQQPLEVISQKFLSKIKYGELSVKFPTGRTKTFTGINNDYKADLTINNYKFISKILKRKSVGFAESYMDGDFETSNLSNLLFLAHQNESVFLKDKRCSVYKSRPIQCRTWPLWNENMHAKRWNLKITKFCPGINKGAILSKKKILNILEKDKKNDELILKQNINHQK